MDGLIEGRIVHFVLPEGARNAGEHRAAMIVKVFPTLKETGTVNLLVFTDGANDMDDGKERIGMETLWVTSVHYSETQESRTWHWPERA